MTTLMEAATVGKPWEPDQNNGRYCVTIDGKKVRMTRASTFAGITQDRFSLDQWRSRMILTGLQTDRDLQKQLLAINTGDGKALNALAEQAAAAGGANEGREAGTRWHNIIEEFVKGRPIDTFDTELQPKITAFEQACEAAGLTFTQHIEVAVVNQPIEVAGRFDYLVRLADGRLVTADLKTSKSIDQSGLSFATQLAVYAMHTGVISEDGTVGPKIDGVDQDIALIIWLPATSEDAICEIHEVRLSGADGGIDAVILADNLRGTRNAAKRKTAANPLVRPFVSPVVEDNTTSGAVVASQKIADEVAIPLATSSAPASKHAELQQRFDALIAAGHRELLVAAWTELHTPKISSPEQTPETLAAIDRATSPSEAGTQAAFAPSYIEPAKQPTETDRRVDALPADLYGMIASNPEVPLETLELQAAERVAQITQHLSELSDAEADRVLRVVRVKIGDANALEAERIIALAEGIRMGVIAGDLTVPVDAPELLGSRQETLKRGRAAAKVHSLPAPRSADEVSSNPLLRVLAMRAG